MSRRSVAPPRPLPVLFLVPRLGVGGAERQLFELVTRMNRDRFRPIVVCQKDGGHFFDEIAAAGVTTLALQRQRGQELSFAWQLARLCRREDVRAIVITGFSTGVIGRIVGRLLGVRPIIMAEHSTGRIDPDRKKPPIERLLAPFADGVIAVAHGQVPFLVQDIGFQESRIRVIHNGIDLSRWSPRERDTEVCAELGIAADAPVVGILAMLRPEKDHRTFLEAARLVHAELPQARFLIVGEGEQKAELEVQADRLGLANVAIFTGRRTDVPRLLSIFDVSVLSSVTVETFPMAFLEAMAMAKPLVTTQVGGVVEMIHEGSNGYVVPPRDFEALARSILDVVRNRNVAREMGRESRRIVERCFSVEKMVSGTEDFLDSFFPG